MTTNKISLLRGTRRGVRGVVRGVVRGAMQTHNTRLAPQRHHKLKEGRGGREERGIGQTSVAPSRISN